MQNNTNKFEYDDFSIAFSDLTVIEGKGNYNKIKKLFDREIFGNDYWMIETVVTILHESGAANMILHLFSDRKVTIESLSLSTSEVHYCPDIPILASWTQQEGWNLPEPSADLIRDSEDFWKFFYDTSMIYSPILENKYGKIEPIYEDDSDDDEINELYEE